VEDRGPSAYIAEFLGTLVLVFAIVMVLATNSATLVVVALVHVFVLAMLISSLGGTSGAHFNPAVSVTLAVLRKIKPADAAIYVVMQLAGAVAGVALAKLILSDEVSAANYGANVRGPLISNDTPLAFVSEAIGTFLLMWAIMAAAVNPRAEGSMAPWIIGATLGLAVMLFGPVTGAGLNPARAFGPAVVGEAFDSVGRWLIAFVAGPIVGALAAGIAYTELVLKPQERLFGGRLVDADVPPGRVPGEVESALDAPGERPVDKLS
jgi:MIP family channel proteins